jgi:hypothetical protein
LGRNTRNNAGVAQGYPSPAPNFQYKYIMLIISYQGIYDGQNFEDANTPSQITNAFNNGYSVMADVWRFDDTLYLGRENDWIEVTDKSLQGVRFWLNCQNQDAYDYLFAQSRRLYPNVFIFSNVATEASPTVSTGGQTIVPGTVPIDNNSVVYLPEITDRAMLSTVKLRCYGVTSVYCTFIRRMRNEGEWY